MKKEYTRYGKCIWCGKEKPEVSFCEKPHTISKKLGSNNIGVDICDSCNKYFGTRERSSKYPMSVELAFKEIFNVSRFLMPDSSGQIQGSILKSIYFEYYASKRILRIKNNFKFQENFLRNFTRQFKRGVYEAFLQEFHRETGRALENKFDYLRRFVRYDLGDIPLFFADNNGVYLLPENRLEIFFGFGDQQISMIDNYGFYDLWFFGHLFYLAVTPKANLSDEVFLKGVAKQIGAPGLVYSGIKKMKYITDLDFSYLKLYNK
jgi:transcription elongation factor Elf1